MRKLLRKLLGIDKDLFNLQRSADTMSNRMDSLSEELHDLRDLISFDLVGNLSALDDELQDLRDIVSMNENNKNK